MVRVLIIHNIIAPYRLPLFEKLAQHPIVDDLTVYYCLERYGDRLWKTYEKTKYHRYEVLHGLTFKIPFINLPCSINPSIIKKMQDNNFDVIILTGFTDFTTQIAFCISKLRNKRIILWSELTGHFLTKYIKLYLHIIKLFLNIPDALIVPSRISKEFHMKLGVSPDKIYIAPNSVDTEKYCQKASNYRNNKENIKKSLSIHNEKIILFVGRLIERKGVAHLIEAYDEIKRKDKNIGLIVVGEGPLKSHLIDLCRERGVKDVYFPGFVSEDEKIKYYSISDVFVLPSLWELNPLVLSEAMSCGLPVITTNMAANAFDMIVEGKNGFIIEKENLGKLSEVLSYTLENSYEMGKYSLKTIQNMPFLKRSLDGFATAIEYAISGRDKKG